MDFLQNTKNMIGLVLDVAWLAVDVAWWVSKKTTVGVYRYFYPVVEEDTIDIRLRRLENVVYDGL